MNISAYLDRIAYCGSTAPTLNTLRAIHHAHILAVPFENLDIGLGREIVLQEEPLIDKIVVRRRGGFCYELNGAFAILLRELGFRVECLNARVANAQSVFGIEFDHLALRVLLDEPWLADVGFGDSFREPLRLSETAGQERDGITYRLDVENGERILLRVEEGQWRPQYRFGMQAYRLADFRGGCTYHQTSPDSPFTRRRVCTLATPEGRITLSDMKLVVTRNGSKEERILKDEQSVADALSTYFQIVLN
jgi:N-hydroxyarylamine O-acetyltransferase